MLYYIILDRSQDDTENKTSIFSTKTSGVYYQN